jgi:hypothetical protein
MQNVVYFPEELQARAPSSVGVLYFTPTHEWGTLFNVIDVVRTGETVTIRPATPEEVERAEKRVVLYEISLQLGAHIGSLLDHEPPEVAAAQCAHLSEALKSCTALTLPDVVQTDAEPEAAAAEDTQGDVFAALPHLYAALHCAHVIGAEEAVDSLDADIKSVLRGEMDADTGLAHAAAWLRAAAQ